MNQKRMSIILIMTIIIVTIVIFGGEIYNDKKQNHYFETTNEFSLDYFYDILEESQYLYNISEDQIVFQSYDTLDYIFDSNGDNITGYQQPLTIATSNQFETYFYHYKESQTVLTKVPTQVENSYEGYSTNYKYMISQLLSIDWENQREKFESNDIEKYSLLVFGDVYTKESLNTMLNTLKFYNGKTVNDIQVLFDNQALENYEYNNIDENQLYILVSLSMIDTTSDQDSTVNVIDNLYYLMEVTNHTTLVTE